MATSTAKTAAKPKAKPAAKKATKTTDIIADTAHQVENLTKESAFEMVRSLDDETSFAQFRLGGALSVIAENKWFVEDGYENFRTFVEGEFGLKYRKAMYLIEIYEKLVESGVEYSKVANVGWTKLKEICGLITPENVDDWVQTANNMTVLKLKQHIKELNKQEVETSGEAGETAGQSEEVSTMTFKLFQSQREIVDDAIEQGLEDAGSTYKSVALEAICMAYLNGGGSGKPAKPAKSLKQQMEGVGWEAVLGVFEELWPEIDLEVKA